MEIISVIICCGNAVSDIDSFAVYEEQFSDEVMDEAREHFLTKIEEFIGEELSDEDRERYLMAGFYKDETDSYYSINIAVSYV